MEREIEAADGIWFRRRILPYRTGGGRVEGVVITFTDITARKVVGHALEAAKMDAEAANAAKTRFLAAASHDLRQPLQTLALLQALLADAVTGAKAKDLVTRQNTTLGTVTSMLDTLLDINEIEAGAVEPDVSVFAIDDLLERLRGEFTYHAEAKSIQLRVVPCGQSVRSDPKLLEQMIRNLLSNAIKYTSQGGVLLGCRRHGDKLALEVWDTGIGIQDTNLAAIFEEYYQIGNEARQRSLGLGLGLSIVKRLADLLGHPVRVLSRFGHGSGFSIQLPRVVSADAASPIAVREERAGSHTTLRTLVVEDDPDLAEMLGELLRSQGHQVTIAPDGTGALACVARSMPDLVVADYNLPDGPDGLELAAAIRAVAGRQLAVIILTGDISNATSRAVARAGCTLLSKPVGLHELQRAIASVSKPADTSQPMIFVVDDDDDVRGAIMEILQTEGRIVAGFPSSEAFLRAFRPGAAGCLLVDAALPGMSGIELLEHLRAEGHNLPAIVITGQSDVPMAIRAMKAGASDFIEKPVDRPSLLTSVARALERSGDAVKLAAWHDAAAGQVAGLTPRQREIMTLVLAGHPSKNIAADLASASAQSRTIGHRSCTGPAQRRFPPWHVSPLLRTRRSLLPIKRMAPDRSRQLRPRRLRGQTVLSKPERWVAKASHWRRRSGTAVISQNMPLVIGPTAKICRDTAPDRSRTAQFGVTSRPSRNASGRAWPLSSKDRSSGSDVRLKSAAGPEQLMTLATSTVSKLWP